MSTAGGVDDGVELWSAAAASSGLQVCFIVDIVLSYSIQFSRSINLKPVKKWAKVKCSHNSRTRSIIEIGSSNDRELSVLLGKLGMRFCLLLCIDASAETSTDLTRSA